MVNKVEDLNSLLMAAWIASSVAKSTEAVASSMICEKWISIRLDTRSSGTVAYDQVGTPE